jgi:Asp/Glu/hydantoin racemase
MHKYRSSEYVGTRPETVGKVVIILGVAMFAALMESLFVPLGPTVPPIIVGVMTVVTVLVLIWGLFSGK